MEDRTLKLELAKTKIGEVERKDRTYSVLYGGILDIYETDGRIIPIEKEEHSKLLTKFLLSDEGKKYIIPSQIQVADSIREVTDAKNLTRLVTRYEQEKRIKSLRANTMDQFVSEEDQKYTDEELAPYENINPYMPPQPEVEAVPEVPVEEETEEVGKNGKKKKKKKGKKAEPKNEIKKNADNVNTVKKLNSLATLFKVLGIILAVISVAGGLFTGITSSGGVVDMLIKIVGALIGAAIAYITMDLTHWKFINMANIEKETDEMVKAKVSIIKG